MQICLRLLSLLAILTLAACSSGPYGPVLPTDQEVAELAREIRSLGPDVDPEEAQRAARIAYEYPYELSQEYQITDRPLVQDVWGPAALWDAGCRAFGGLEGGCSPRCRVVGVRQPPKAQGNLKFCC